MNFLNEHISENFILSVSAMNDKHLILFFPFPNDEE